MTIVTMIILIVVIIVVIIVIMIIVLAGLTVSFQNVKSQNFKLSVSNPKNKDSFYGQFSNFIFVFAA